MQNKNKKTLVSIVEAVAREGAGLLPAGGLGYDLIKELVLRAKSHYSDQSEAKLEQFYDGLLKGNSEELINQEFIEDDYFLLLKKLIQDDENEKNRYYVNLMKGIISSDLNEDYKRHYILALSELNYFDIKVMRKIYIYSHYEMEFSGNILEQLKSIYDSKVTLTKSSIGNLFRLGFVEEVNDIYQPTDILDSFLSLICEPEELFPRSLGEKSVEYVDVYVSNFVSSKSEINKFFSLMERDHDEVKIKVSHYVEVVSKVKKVLEAKGVSYISSTPGNFHKLQNNVRLHILCVDHGDNHMNMAYWHRNVLKGDNVIKLLMSKSANGQPYDSVKHYNGYSIDFTTCDKNSSLDDLSSKIDRILQTEP